MLRVGWGPAAADRCKGNIANNYCAAASDAEFFAAPAASEVYC